MTAAPAASMLPRLTKYELLEEIGHGGMATVYRARDRRLLRDVAVKIIHRHLRENAEVGARFVAEARAVAKLRHPNIVEVYDVSGEDDAERFLVVELLRGKTLRKLLSEHPEMPAEVGAAIGIELAEALAHAHEAGVIHRDVKPENVLVEIGEAGDQARIKLTDFGIAKILDGQGVTHTGQVLGSPAYMAPEQIEGDSVDARADVFGLGVLLYECMVGHPPFEGANPAQVLRRVLDGLYAPAERERAKVGGRWSKILDRALAKAPEARFPTAEALADALRAELLALGIVDPRDEIVEFFADPEGYEAKLADRLVASLTTRGEAARRASDRLGAAADFNRALAFAPDDAELLKQVLRLSRGARRERVFALSAAVLGGCLLLGAAAFAFLKEDEPSPRPPKPAPKLAAPEARPKPASPSPAPLAAAAPSAVPAPPVSPTLLPARGGLSPVRRREVALPSTREVRFELNPKGALVSINGEAPEDLFGQAKRLPVGTHRVTLTVPNSSCCSSTSHKIEVKAGEGAQRFGLAVAFREARVTTQAAPEGALLRCPALHIEGAASRTFAVKMTSLEIAGTCWIDAPSQPTQATTLTLRAGETTTIAWR